MQYNDSQVILVSDMRISAQRLNFLTPREKEIAPSQPLPMRCVSRKARYHTLRRARAALDRFKLMQGGPWHIGDPSTSSSTRWWTMPGPWH